MSSISIQNSSSEGSSTLVDTDESTQYLEAIFHELDPDSQKLDPQRYKVLTYDEANEDVAAIIKGIKDAIDQQQSSSVFAGDFVIIVYNGTAIEEKVFKHLEGLDVRFTSLSGPGDCLILTMATSPHDGAAVLFSTARDEIRDEIRDTTVSNIQSKLVTDMQTKILDKLHVWLLEPSERSQEQQSQRLQSQLDEVREALRVGIQTALPNIPVQSTGTLDFLLNTLLNEVQRDLLLEEYELSQVLSLHSQTQKKLSLLRDLKQKLQAHQPSGPQKALRDLIKSQLGPGQLIVAAGSFKIPLYIHSGQSICTLLFNRNERHTAKGLLEKKKWDAVARGSKIPDYTIAPRYLYFVHSAQHRPFVPPLTVEVGLTDNKVKVLVDCIFTILGTRFQVDAAYGVDLHVNRARKMLQSIDIYHFDISLEALVDIRDEITPEHDRASVSKVIGQKAQQKFNDLTTLELLREWRRTGDTSEDRYKRVLDQIKDLRIRYLLPYAPVPTDEQDRTPMSAAIRILQSYEQYRDETLREEKAYYNGIVTECRRIVDQYMESEGTGMSEEQLVREGEVLLVKQIYERKTWTRVDENSREPLPFSIKDFTGVKLLSEETISLSPGQLQDSFSQIAMLFQESSVDNVEVRLPLLRGLIGHDCDKEVATLNYPHLSPDEAKAELDRAYSASPDDFVELRVKTRHVDVRSQLSLWGIEPEPTEYGNKILFLHECSKRYPNRDRQETPFEPAESSQDPHQSPGNLGERYGDDSDSNEPESSSAGPLGQSSQGPLEPPKRGHSSSPSSGRGQTEGQTLVQTLRSGAETLRRKVRKLSGMSKATYTPSTAQDSLSRTVYECIDRASAPKRFLVRRYLMKDEVKSIFQDKERNPEFLPWLEEFLDQDFFYIKGTLANPNNLKGNLEGLAGRAERRERERSGQTD
uniref:ARAD1B10758p n=1 Tax=Blastobotrys adeninivorans TaxID=409370 RepID=A0A060T5F4_BLAAD